METVLFAHIRVGDGPRVGACQASSWRRVRCRGLTAVVESKNSIQTLLPFAGISDLVKGAQLGHTKFCCVDSARRGQYRVSRNARRGSRRYTGNNVIDSLRRLPRVDSNPPDTAEDRVEKLASWPRLVGDAFVPLVRLELTLTNALKSRDQGTVLVVTFCDNDLTTLIPKNLTN